MSKTVWKLDRWLDHIARVHYRSIDLTLDRVRRVAHCLRVPATTRYITVAGTNGKGSSVAYLESIYRCAGFTTGAYTSPHLVHYNERVRLNGQPVSDELLEAAFLAVETARSSIPLTYFEFGTLAALWIFRRELPDVVILEVGMGGRLDAVNIIDSDIALITAIGLDHQQWLGNTVEKIAVEKAGVLRHSGLAVSSGCRPPSTLAEVAVRKHCDLWQLGQQFGYESRPDSWDWLPLDAALDDLRPVAGLPVPLGGIHQLDNAAGVIAAVRRLSNFLPVSDQNLALGLERACLPGRLQRIDGHPELLLDVSHNVDGLEVLSTYLRSNHSARRVLGVFSMLGDKDIQGALERVADCIDYWFIASLDSDRAAPSEVLRSAISVLSKAPVDIAPDIQGAADRALSMATGNDLLVVFGSFVVVGDIMRHLHLDPYPAS